MADIVTGNEFLRMQNDAVNRVRQMQRRAETFVPPAAPPGNHQPQEEHKSVPAPPQAPQASRPMHAAPHPHHAPVPIREEPQQQALLGGLGDLLGGGGSISGILESFFGGESDKLLVLGLIWLLSKEKADQMLLMALFYILM